jgi:hypothetical protein
MDASLQTGKTHKKLFFMSNDLFIKVKLFVLSINAYIYSKY